LACASGLCLLSLAYASGWCAAASVLQSNFVSRLLRSQLVEKLVKAADFLITDRGEKIARRQARFCRWAVRQDLCDFCLAVHVGTNRAEIDRKRLRAFTDAFAID